MTSIKQELMFFKGRKVFVTGHNGFKGTWICKMLADIGADVCGFSLPHQDESMFKLMGLEKKVRSIEGDVGNTKEVADALSKFSPEVVIHMAAQPLVLESYKDPVGTYRTNVMGTVNVLDAVRNCAGVLSVVNVTTDKVYKNLERDEGYKEDEVLEGYDPYSNSKSCSELVTAAYRRSFFNKLDIPVSTCRAGNVIGGGDFAKDRIIPDCVRSAERGEKICLRNPNSVRPYQHVLEPVSAYLLLAAKQADDHKLAGSYNIGPNEDSTVTTEKLAKMFCNSWDGAEYEVLKKSEDVFHEANLLRLDCTKFKKAFKWKPKWNIEETVDKTVKWYLAHRNGKDMDEFTAEQIKEFLS